jgi:hypothetical protein
MKGEYKMPNNKLLWLRRILAVKVVLTFLFWGLPTLFFPMSVLQSLGVPTTADPLYLRLLGAVIMAIGVAYWYAYRNPIHNVAILRAGVVDNGLVTLVTLYFIVFAGLRSVIMLISAPLTLIFFISLILLMPKTEAA